MKNELVSSLAETIFDNSSDIGIDFLEIALDEIIENETIKEIPIIGSIVKLSKTAIAINDRRLIKKLLIFTQKINAGNIPKEKIEKHRKELEENSKRKQRELEYIIAILDKQIEYEKSNILAKFYMAYLKEHISWERFCCFSDLVDRLVLYDWDLLKEIYDKYSFGEKEAPDVAQMSRLNSLGLVQYFNGTVVMVGKNKSIRGRISCEGKVFCECLFDE